ncbi:MAG: putative chemotaxis protein CheW [Labilithrix sp.]|nr:putative chemotaxis protein CheW [Labilithrix sp.]
MPPRSALLRFRLGGERFAIRATGVVEVIPAVAPGPLPFVAGVVAGAVVVRGALMALLDVRAALALPGPPLSSDDHFVIVALGGRTVALVTEGVEDFTAVDDHALVPARMLSERGPAGAHVAQLADGTWAVLDLDAFLTAAELVDLDRELASARESTT